MFQAVPRILLDHGHPNLVTAGEQLVCTDNIRRWFAGLPGARLFNHYGPTETHVVSALCLEGDPGQWPERPAIGGPVAGAGLRVVDAQGDPAPTGRTGELLIGGTMTTRCYLDEPTLDDARFVELPGAGLFYRSGDRAFFDRAGLLHYAGRDDQQIKLSGHRLELGSVEAALLRHPAVVNAVVTRDGDRLTAGLEVRGEAPSADDLTAHLSALLPSYVRVDRFRRLERLPRTPSGKLDRQAVVRAPGEAIRRSAIARTGLSAEEERLTAVFEEVTGLTIAPDQTFFEAGASSLALMRFHLRCTTALGLRFGVADLFEHVTVRSLAHHLTAPRPLTPSAAKNDGAPEPGEPIAVVGMAVRVPGAPDLAAFWELVVSGGTGIRRIDAPEGVVGAHSTLDGMLDFDPGHFGISPQEARLMDPQQRHLLMAGVQALAHAGVADTSSTRVGLVAGAGENTYFQSLLREADPGRLPDGWQLALHHEKDFLATKVAYHLGLTGPAFSAQTACSSSLVAVHLAAGLLRQGEADVMLAGGVLVDPGLTGGYRYRPQHIFSADGDCRPFSDDATGTVGASGVGVVVLKTLRQARRDGDTVHALITGSAINNDGAAKMSYTAPSSAPEPPRCRASTHRRTPSGWPAAAAPTCAASGNIAYGRSSPSLRICGWPNTPRRACPPPQTLGSPTGSGAPACLRPPRSGICPRTTTASSRHPTWTRWPRPSGRRWRPRVPVPANPLTCKPHPPLEVDMESYEREALEAVTTRPVYSYRTLTVERITPVLGAEVSGVDLSQEIPAEQLEEIRVAFRDHHVLVFRDQTITAEQHKRFAAAFGEPRPVNPPPPEGDPCILEIRTTSAAADVAGNGWHADGTRTAQPTPNHHWGRCSTSPRYPSLDAAATPCSPTCTSPTTCSHRPCVPCWTR